MLIEKKFHLKSNGPMITHNGQLANPSNEFSKAMKLISGKRGKTDADFEELARLEFLGGLYPGEDGPIIPADNLRSMLIRAARKVKEGKLAESGLFITSSAVMQYDGPRDPYELWADESFRFQKMVVVSRSRILRTRPIFNEWAADVELMYDDDVIQAQQLENWFNIGGHIIGLGDWRPQYGRFSASNGS